MSKVKNEVAARAQRALVNARSLFLCLLTQWLDNDPSITNLILNKKMSFHSGYAEGSCHW